MHLLLESKSHKTYQKPFRFKDIIVDSDIFFNNTIKSFITFGLGHIKQNDDEILVPYGLLDFINFTSIINLINRFIRKVQNSNIYNLTTAEYTERAIGNNKNISIFFKESYLKEKQKISSYRVNFLYKTKLLIKDINTSNKYKELLNTDDEFDIEIKNDVSYSLKKSYHSEFKEIIETLENDIKLIEIKENILNDTFRDLTTLTTNELNFMLQKRMKQLSLLAIVIAIFSFFKPEIKNIFFKSEKKSVVIIKDSININNKSVYNKDTVNSVLLRKDSIINKDSINNIDLINKND